jgi:excisionase family DNA binding protein
MMSNATMIRDFEVPDQDLVNGAERALAELDVYRSAFDGSGPGQLVALTLNLPPFAARLLFDALTALADGHAVTVVPIAAELTTQEAADVLNVSRPYLIKLLNDRKIPHRKVGNRRKVLLEDVLRFKRGDDQVRQDVLDELSREAQAIGLEY